MLKIALSTLALLFLAGCAGMQSEGYGDEKQAHYKGKLQSRRAYKSMDRMPASTPVECKENCDQKKK